MAAEGAQNPAEYRVLARKYRPAHFDELIGQDALVRTLRNAIESDRLAHAFILTGVRGVGKTTTARIIARALNYTGADGTAGPTVGPTDDCEICRAISEGRCVDVIEMDAATHTGVEDVREIIEGVRYRPTQARYKIYIIDEVHMLSKAAFNALLKTLEEPPEHVKFIFATTEIRKVPVTVLSRCQRFDLRRVDAETLAGHFTKIAAAENAEIEPGAVALIARAADGSVRDGLSLLDQAIAHGGGRVSEELVRDMLGLADRVRVFDLLDAVMQGEIAQALEILRGLYDYGADPAVVLQDMLELVHWLTRLKIVPVGAAEAAGVPEAERERGREMAEKLPMPALTRAWQMLLKGLEETARAPQPILAAEMVLIRLAYAADLPNPADLVRELQKGGQPAAAPRPGNGAGSGNGNGGATAVSREPAGGGSGNGGGRPHAALRLVEPEPEPAPAEPAPAHAMPADFEALVALFTERREARLSLHLSNDVHLVRYEPGRLEFRPGERAPRDLANRVGKLLEEWTGARWMISVSSEPGQPTLRDQRAAAEDARLAEAEAHPMVRAVLDTFPGATISKVSARELLPDPAQAEDEEGEIVVGEIDAADPLGEGDFE
jgi:DNA polymerase-3 subunit gamma/tau